MFRIRIKNEKHKALIALPLGLLLFGFGLSWIPQTRENYSAYSAIHDKGIETKAHISNGGTVRLKGTEHYIYFSWRDLAGKEREIQSLTVGEDFWKRIAPGKDIVVREIPIKYLESDHKPRAILVWDPNAAFRTVYMEIGGVILMILMGGAGIVNSLMFFWNRRKQPSDLVNAVST